MHVQHVFFFQFKGMITRRGESGKPSLKSRGPGVVTVHHVP